MPTLEQNLAFLKSVLSATMPSSQLSEPLSSVAALTTGAKLQEFDRPFPR